MKYKISATQLESFRSCLDNDRFFQHRAMSPEKLVQQLLRKSQPSKWAYYGTAFHAIIQEPHLYEKPPYGYVYDGIIFSDEDIQKCLTTLGYAMEGVYEVPFQKVYDLGENQIAVSMRLDVIRGNIINEIKTTQHFDYDKYSRSIQHKIYLDATEAEELIYNVFVINDKAGTVSIETAVEPFSFFFDSNLSTDIKNVLRSFLIFIKENNIGRYFESSN